MDVDRLLTATRSARKSLDLQAAIDLTEVRECLRIGLAAPSGSNQQAWRWVVVTDADLRARIASLYRTTYLDKVGGQLIAGLCAPVGRLQGSRRGLICDGAVLPPRELIPSEQIFGCARPRRGPRSRR